jgi:polyisoprenoid-binding protein YceI
LLRRALVFNHRRASATKEVLMSVPTFELERTSQLAGVWKADRVHSSIRFAVRHIVSTFQGEVPDFDAELRVNGDISLSGRGRVTSIETGDETLDAHLIAPDFFDAERHPEVALVSSSVDVDDDRVAVQADLSIKDTTRPVVLEGTVAGPVADPFGGTRLALTLETVIDRRDFGLGWNLDLPGGGQYLGDEVVLSAELELVKESDS